MGQIEVISNLNQYFIDETSRQIASRLVFHSLITEYLSTQDNIDFLFTKLGNNIEKWTPIYIYQLLAGNSESTKTDYFCQNENQFTRQIKNLVIGEFWEFSTQLSEKVSLMGWKYIFSLFKPNQLTLKARNESLLNAIEIILENGKNHHDLIMSAFRKDQKEGLWIIARLINRKVKISAEIVDLIENDHNEVEISLFSEFIRLHSQMGNKSLSKKLVQIYTKRYFNENNNKVSNLPLESILQNVEKKIQISALYELCEDFLSAEEWKKEALVGLEKIHAALNQSELNINVNLNEHSLNLIDQYAEDQNINSVQNKLKNIFDAIKIDKKTAKSIAENVYKQDFEHRIINQEDDSVYRTINPIQIVNVYLELDLIHQAYTLALFFSRIFPENIELFRLALNIATNYGDNYGLLEIMEHFSGLTEISRSEKILWANALLTAGEPLRSFKLWKNINLVSADDIYDLLLSAFKSDHLQDVNGILQNYSEDLFTAELANFVTFLVNADKSLEGESALVDLILSSDRVGNFNETELACLLFISKGKPDQAILIAEKYIENNPITIQFQNLQNLINEQTGKSSIADELNIKNIDESGITQDDLETWLWNHYSVPYFDEILKKCLEKWPLSKKIRLIAGKKNVEKKDYLKSQTIFKSLLLENNEGEEAAFNYCMAVLNCDPEFFPNNFSEIFKKDNFISQLVKNNFDKHPSIKWALLNLELHASDKINSYQDLFKQKYKDADNAWRIYGGLGKALADKNYFDQAIPNLKIAHTSQPKNKFIIWQLFKAYLHLRLWNEAEILFISNPEIEEFIVKLLDSPSSLPFLSSDEWQKLLDQLTLQNPDSTNLKIAKAINLLLLGSKEKASDYIKKITNDIELNHPGYLTLIQMLISITEFALAEHMLSTKLVQSNLKDNELIAASFLYSFMGKNQKAFTVINQITGFYPALFPYLLKISGEETRKDLSKLKFDFSNPNKQKLNLEDFSVKVPDEVVLVNENDAALVLHITSWLLNLKCASEAENLYKEYLSINPDDEELLSNFLDYTALIESEENEAKRNDYFSRISPLTNNVGLLCIKAEHALSIGCEIEATELMTCALRIDSSDLRIKALQMRLLLRIGNRRNALVLYDEIIREYLNNNPSLESHKTLNSFPLWLITAAAEIGNFRTSLDYCCNVIGEFGIYKPIAGLFLKSYAEYLERKIIEQRLLMKPEKALQDDDYQKVYEEIEKWIGLEDFEGNLKELLFRCKSFLSSNVAVTTPQILEKLSEIGYVNSVIYFSFIKNNKVLSLDSFNFLRINPENEFFMAILECNSNPQNSKKHLMAALKGMNITEEAYTLLAIIENNLGNFSDAYAAISLAINIKPEIAGWQKLAGDICLKLGNVHASSVHYEIARKLLTEGELAPTLERDLILNSENGTLNTRNMEDFMNLGKKYLENSKFQKAIKIFLKLANTEMENTGPLFWLSETFIRIGNLKSAEEYIDKALETDNLSFKNQVKKVEIIKLQNGYNSALDYINVLQKNGQANSEAIACLKAEIIAENESVEKAITYLESLKKKDLPEILYRLARFYYEVGDNNNLIDCANQLSDINGTSSKDLHIQALLAWNNGELDRAVDFLVHSIEKDPFIPEKYMHLSQVYADRKEWHAVFETINDGLRIEPENVELWLQKIKFLKINGKLEEAKQNQKAACRIRPNDLRLENLFI